MKINFLLLTLFTLIMMGCTEKDLFVEQESSPELKSSTPKLKIAVVSDIHYMDHSLLPAVPEENPDFQKLLLSGYNKLVEMSEPIFLQALENIKIEKPDVLLIPGDMAFNGELINHLIVKDKLQELADLGIRVLVVPGNNDINSPDAMKYEGTGAIPVAIISPADFVSIYGNFGYDDALYRDASSLSYIFQVRNDLWVLGIDACIYTPAYSRRGAVKDGTMTWIQQKMVEAKQNGITVLALMHHGITEHYSGQSTVNRGDVVNNYSWVSNGLMEAGIRFVFTGHSHSTDIVEVSGNGKSILDIETGSLITPLSPYRIVTMDDNFMKVATKKITHIDESYLNGQSFLTYSDSYLAGHLDLFFKGYLINMFKLPPEMADAFLPCLRNSIMAQFAGDEKLLPPEAGKIDELDKLFPGNPVVPIIKSFWTDLPPADNKINIRLK